MNFVTAADLNRVDAEDKRMWAAIRSHAKKFAKGTVGEGATLDLDAFFRSILRSPDRCVRAVVRPGPRRTVHVDVFRKAGYKTTAVYRVRDLLPA